MKPIVRKTNGTWGEGIDGNGNEIIYRSYTILYQKPPPNVKIVFAYEFIEGISMTISEALYKNNIVK